MEAHLIKSDEVPIEFFEEVLVYLRAIPGVNLFGGDTSSNVCLPENNVLSWSQLFTICEEERNIRSLNNDCFLFLLTNKNNVYNFFGFLNPVNPYDGFVNTVWEEFIECNPAIPVAYHIVALMIQKHMIKNMAEIPNLTHTKAIGCVNDFCKDKYDVILKLRTADICHQCMNTLSQNLSLPVINHALAIFESLRVKMLFSQNMRQNTKLSPLVIDSENRIILPEYGNMEILLRPLEKSLYFLYWNHPEGIQLSSLIDHKSELYRIYESISGRGSIPEMQDSIDDMCNSLSGSASQKISRIQNVFNRAVGLELSKYYCIKGERGEPKYILAARIK